MKFNIAFQLIFYLIPETAGSCTRQQLMIGNTKGIHSSPLWVGRRCHAKSYSNRENSENDDGWETFGSNFFNCKLSKTRPKKELKLLTAWNSSLLTLLAPTVPESVEIAQALWPKPRQVTQAGATTGNYSAFSLRNFSWQMAESPKTAGSSTAHD